MEKDKAIVSKEPELQKIILQKREEVFKKEEELYALVEDFVAIKSAIKTFYLKVYLPELGAYIEELENLKNKLLGIKTERKDEEILKEDKNELPDNLKNELKILYRKLARLYHPDKLKNLSPQEKKFFNKRMSEINEAFQKKDIESLRRIFKKAEAEIGLNISSLERIKYFETDLLIMQKMQELYRLKIENLKSNYIYCLMKKTEKERKQAIEELKLRFISEIKIYKEIYTKIESKRKTV